MALLLFLNELKCFKFSTICRWIDKYSIQKQRLLEVFSNFSECKWILRLKVWNVCDIWCVHNYLFPHFYGHPVDKLTLVFSFYYMNSFNICFQQCFWNSASGCFCTDTACFFKCACSIWRYVFLVYNSPPLSMGYVPRPTMPETG